MDPLHLVMHYEEACGRNRTAGSSWLRLAVERFSVLDRTLPEDAWGEVYRGEVIDADATETTLLRQVADGSMSTVQAKMTLEDLRAHRESPWYSREDFMRAVAAISHLYPADMAKRRPGTPHTVREILCMGADVSKVEWLLNATRFAHSLPAAIGVLRPTGTTSNEALHSELNATFRRVQALHRSSMEARLAFFTVGKLAAHNSALYRAGIAQARSSMVLARTIGPLNLFSAAQWATWCRRDPCGTALRVDRAQEREAARRFAAELAATPATTLKRPAGSAPHPPPPKASRTERRHRTVFELPRPGRVWH